MKYKWYLLSAFILFGLGFIAGQHSEIYRIFADDAGVAVPTATNTPTPTLTIIPTPSPLPQVNGVTIPRYDIVQIGGITVDKTTAQAGDDIQFTVTIKNQSGNKKNIKQLCFNSTDGNFGCTLDFNLYSGQSFQFNNSGRFTSGGVKTVWVTWTQDGENFFRPQNSTSAKVTIVN